MPRVADTSVLYAFAVADDAHHARAVKDVAMSEPIVVPAPILVETGDLLTFRHGWKVATGTLAALLDLPHLSPAEGVPFAAVQRVHAAAKGKLSLADAFVVQTCLALGSDPLSYDRNIQRAIRAAGVQG